MAEISEEHFKEFMRICEQEGIKYDTEAEYRDSARNLVGFVDVLMEMSKDDLLRQKWLEKEPKGFEMEGEGRTCHLCGRSNYDLKLWYDKWGMKCMDCQDALNKKIIPGYVFKDYKNEKHITASTLSWKMDIRQQTIRKLVRQGKLKVREIPRNRTMVFLRKENPDLAYIVEAAKVAKDDKTSQTADF